MEKIILLTPKEYWLWSNAPWRCLCMGEVGSSKMNTSRVNWHSQVLLLPSWISAVFVGLAVGKEWIGVLLLLLTMRLADPIYGLYFSASTRSPRRRHIGTNAFFLISQLIFWATVFLLLYAFQLVHPV
jgi:hypothetical protein